MIRSGVLSLTIVALLAGPALASQCPALIKQVRDGVGNRFDNAKYQALALAAEAEKLHNDGKHAESEAKAEAAAKAAGITLKKK
jgi:hypothetical protein